MSDFISIEQSDYLTAAQIDVVLSTRINKKSEVKAKPVVGSVPVEFPRAGSPDSTEADQSVVPVLPSTFDAQTVSVALSNASEVMDSAIVSHIRHLCGVSVDDERNPKRIRTIGPDIDSRRHMSLIQAVCDVIAALPTVEMRDRFASNILLVGGGALLRGLTERFEELLNQAMTRHQASILRPPKVHAWVDIDPVHLAWKGAAVLVATDTNRDNWIERAEWYLRGPSALREKAMYLW
jgi:actin-related protein